MIQEKSGFVYNFETKEVIVEFQIGNNIFPGDGCDIFYGTKDEAILNELISLENETDFI
jgi:hypothetical protein